MLNINDGIVRADRPRARHPIGLTGFFVLAFGLSWTGAAAVALSALAETGAGWAQAGWIAALAPLELLMLFGPLIAAAITLAWNDRPAGIWTFLKRAFRLSVGLRWWALVLILPAAVMALVWPVSGFAGGSAPPPDILSVVLPAAGQLLVFYLLFNTEEIAWRGYALPQLQSLLAPLPANALLTGIWLVFHLPLFAMPGGHPAGYGVGVFIAMVIPIGFIMGAVFNRTAGSVLLVHLLHQGFNAWGEAWRIFPVFSGETTQMWSMVALLWVPGVVAMIWLGLKGKAPESG